MPDPNVPVRVDVQLGAVADGPFLQRGFWNWYFPGNDEPKISQRLKDRLSPRLVSQHPWHYDEGAVHDLSFVFPPVAGKPWVCRVGLNIWSLSLGIEGGHELGYWDEARPQPLTLRWDEVVALVDRAPQENFCSDIVLLLLLPFVCPNRADAGELKQRKSAAAAALNRLGVGGSSLVGNATFINDDYDWAYHQEHGLVVAVDGRFSPRSVGGRFPFDVLRAMRVALGLPDRPEGVADYQPPPPPQRVERKPLISSHPVVGRKMRHPKFGDGIVRSVSASGDKAEVQFESGDRRTLLVSFLQPVD